MFDYKGKGVYSVKVLLRSGKTIRLGAPVHSPVMADPAFDRKVERIITARQQARSGVAPGGGAVADWGVAAPDSAVPGTP